MRPLALVFDYDMLKAATEIDLETYVVPENSLDPDSDIDELDEEGKPNAKPLPPPSLFPATDDSLPF